MGALEQIFSTNTLLMMLVTGVIIWVVRQIIPDNIESSKTWRTVLRVAPVGIGAAVALIPGLRPISDNLVQSAAIGLVGGSFAQTAYGIVREGAGEKVKALMGSRVGRKKKQEGIE